MTSVRVRIDTTKLDAIIRNAPHKASENVRSGALSIEGRAKTLAPVDTGALRNSIHITRRGALTYWTEDGVHYGIYQEYGTYKMRAQPFMLPAALWTLPHYVKLWKNLFEAYG